MTPYATDLTGQASKMLLILYKSEQPIAYIAHVTQCFVKLTHDACAHGRSNLARRSEEGMEALIDELRRAVSRSERTQTSV